MSDETVTHEGVSYHISQNLPPLKCHVDTRSRCLGSGQMYGRDCSECNGRGLLFPALLSEHY